jgi:hypothetical protein
MIGFRADDVTRASIVKWAEGQPDKPTLSDAIRRLVELGLTVKSELASKTEIAKRRQGTKQRARELAGGAVDEMTDTTASEEDQASRKRRLIKGPEEFRGVRVDQPKVKAK